MKEKKGVKERKRVRWRRRVRGRGRGGWEGGLIGRGELNKGIGPTTILRPLVLETEGGGERL